MKANNAIQWRWLLLNEMSGQDFYQVAKLRQEVFIIEQACMYADLDEMDLNTNHLLGMKDNLLVGYLRVLAPANKREPVYFSRVATAITHRKSGIGRILIQQALDFIHEHHKGHEIVISAQTYLEKFYNEFGFIRIGTPYTEDGIPHVAMKRD